MAPRPRRSSRCLANAAGLTTAIVLCLSMAPAESVAKTLRHKATSFSVKAPADFKLRYRSAGRTYTLVSKRRATRIRYVRLRTGASPTAVRRRMNRTLQGKATRSRRPRLDVRRKGPRNIAATVLTMRSVAPRQRRSLIAAQRRVARSARGGRARQLSASGSRASLSVIWLNPKAAATLRGRVAYRDAVSARTTGRVARVELFAGGDRIAIEREAPYSLDLDTTTLANGKHTLTARAYTSTGQSAASAITVNVINASTAPSPLDADGAGNLLFEDRFDLGSAGEGIWGPRQAAQGSLDYVTSPVFSQRTMALRNRLEPGDVHAGTDSARSELTGSSRFYDGDVRWFRMPVRFNEWRLQADAWALIWQAHAGSGSPPLATYIDSEEQLFRVKNGNTGQVFWERSFELGRWYDLVIGARFSHGGDGWVEVWVDGVRQTMHNGQQRITGATLSPVSAHSYDKLGLYQSKSLSSGARELLHGMYRVGTTRSSVTG